MTGAVRYEIRIREQLSETVLGEFPDLHVEAVHAATVLVGQLTDQAACTLFSPRSSAPRPG